MSIINLPDDVQTNILSYLYFSSNTSKNINPNLFLIKNYDKVLYNALYKIHDQDIDLMNKMLLRFLLRDEHHEIYEKLKHYNVEIDYEIYTKYQVRTILKHLNVLETNKIYKFCLAQ